ncbi:MAG: DNA polymerase Y family protein [Sciscionella sp.]
MRTMVVWCPDWPVIAASVACGITAAVPAAVIVANRVVVGNAVARANGVVRGLRRREAQARCPELAVLDGDPGRDLRLFEPVATAVEELAPGVEIVRAGVLAFPSRGPVGYLAAQHRGDEQVVAERVVDAVAGSAGVECQVGVADGLFVALLAAREGVVVPEGGSTDFLAPLGIGELSRYDGTADPAREELVNLLWRLGLRTLGAFAELPERAVVSRFGAEGVRCHRLARGCSERPLARRAPPEDLAVREVYDPPLERVDVAAFAAKALAARLCSALLAHGASCTRLGIRASTERGEQLHRVWRCAEPLTDVAQVADRVRWQLEGWLRGTVDRPSAGLAVLCLEPEETVSGQELQLGLWRGDEHAEANTQRAGRALVRVQALLGPEAAGTAVLGGGRGVRDRVRLVPWGDELSPRLASAPPWPGRLPSPSPATVPPDPLPATVRDASGADVGVTGRNVLTASPAEVSVAGAEPLPVRGWAGPWPFDERWWERGIGQRSARMQVVLADGEEQSALLLARTEGRWLVEGRYD